MKNLSAYHQEDFLRNLKLTLMLILVPLLRELWPFKHRRVFFGTPCIWGIFIEKYQVLYHFGFVRSLPSRCHGSWIPLLPYLSTVHSFVSSSGNVTCHVRGSISFWPPRWIFFFFSFSRPNTPQYWKLIEFWLEFGFSDVFLSFFVKFWHFRHISIHKMSSKS